MYVLYALLGFLLIAIHDVAYQREPSQWDKRSHFVGLVLIKCSMLLWLMGLFAMVKAG